MATKPQVITYGLESERGEDWLKEVLKQPCPQFILELQGFGRKGGTESLGGISKEQHAKNFISAHYPWVWQHWNDWLDLIFWAWSNFEEVAATGCMASGKSYGFALASWMEWAAAPTQSACVISSTTKDGIRSRVWPHMKKLRNSLIIGDQQIRYPCHLVDSRTMIQATKGDDKHSIMSVAVQGGQLEDALGSVQGRHPDRMIIFCDEGQQTPEAIFSARFNLRGGTKLYRFASCANCSDPTGAFGIFLEPKGGWSSVTDSDQTWETKTGIALHFSGKNSPNVIAGRTVVPGLIQREDIEAIRSAKGEDSLEWNMYVLGFPALSGVRNTVLSWADIITHEAKATCLWQGKTRWIGSLDPAFTAGGDKCTLQFARVGNRLDGKMTLGFEPPIEIKLVAGKEISEDYQIALRVKDECNKLGVEAADFAMDSTSATSLASMIEQMWKPGIRRVNFGAAPTDRKMPGETKTAKERTKNRVAEIWFSMAALVRAGQVRGMHADAAREFTTRQYNLQGERYILESKVEMKKRTGGKSPDFSDAASLCGDIFRDIAGLDAGPAAASTSDAWEKAAKRFNLCETYA